MKVANGAMITMDVLENVISDMISFHLLIAKKRSITVLSRWEINVLNVRSPFIGKAGTGSSVLSVKRTVKFVMRTPLIAFHVEMDIGLIIKIRNARMSGQKTSHVKPLRIVLR